MGERPEQKRCRPTQNLVFLLQHPYPTVRVSNLHRFRLDPKPDLLHSLQPPIQTRLRNPENSSSLGSRNLGFRSVTPTGNTNNNHRQPRLQNSCGYLLAITIIPSTRPEPANSDHQPNPMQTPPTSTNL